MAAPLSLQQFQLIKPAVLQGWPKSNADPTFPLNGILDTFDRTDENPLANGNWTSIIASGQGGLKLLSNQAASIAAGDSASYWSKTQFAADQEVFADMPVLTGAGKNFNVWVRVQNPGNPTTGTGYTLGVTPSTGLLKVFKLTAGVTFAQVSQTFPQTVTAGDGFGLSIIGSRLFVWYRVGPAGFGGWKLLQSFTEPAITGPGYIGLEVDDTTGRADNFGGGPIPVSTSVADSTTLGGAIAAGVEPTVQVPVPQGGANAAGNNPTVSVAVPQGGATAGGPSPSVSVAVPQGGATAGGFAPTPATSLTISGATAGGFAPTARVTATISGAIAGGNAPTSAASVDIGGSSTGGFGATVRVSLTIGGASAGGFAPSESSSVAETPTPGGALAGGFGPTVRVAIGTGGATAGGYGPNDGSAPAAGPPGDPNYFLLIHP